MKLVNSGYIIFRIPRSEGHKPCCAGTKVVLFLSDLPPNENKSETYVTRYSNLGQNCESAKHETIRQASFDRNIF